MYRALAALVFSHVVPVAQMTQECRNATRCFDSAMTATTAGVTIGYAHRCGTDLDEMMAAIEAAARFYGAGQDAGNTRLIRNFLDDGWEQGMHSNPPAGFSCQQVRWAMSGLEAQIGAK